jgi:hypothetical protein
MDHGQVVQNRLTSSLAQWLVDVSNQQHRQHDNKQADEKRHDKSV